MIGGVVLRLPLPVFAPTHGTGAGSAPSCQAAAAAGFSQLLVFFERLSLQNMNLPEQVVRQRERAHGPAGKSAVQSRSKLGWTLFCIKHGAASVPGSRPRAFPGSGSSTRSPGLLPTPLSAT